MHMCCMPYVEGRKMGRDNSIVSSLELWTPGRELIPGLPSTLIPPSTPKHIAVAVWRVLKPLAQTCDLVVRLTAQF